MLRPRHVAGWPTCFDRHKRHRRHPRAAEAQEVTRDPCLLHGHPTALAYPSHGRPLSADVFLATRQLTDPGMTVASIQARCYPAYLV
jgi:hypothetical protein